MYNVYIDIYGEFLTSPIIHLYLGVFNRPSTAERRRKELQDNNPMFKFILQYEQIN